MKKPTKKLASTTIHLDRLQHVCGGNLWDALKSCADSKAETQKAIARFQ